MLGICFALIALGVPRSAGALPPCEEAFLVCEDGGVVSAFNLDGVPWHKRKRSWLRAHCRPSDLKPTACDWVRALTNPRARPAPPARVRSDASAPGQGGSSAGRPTVGSSAAGSSAPTRGDRRRDARVRYGPTPAPVPQVPLPAGQDTPYAPVIDEAAARYHLPANLIRAVIQVESAFHPQAESIKGAVGLMQLMPATARAMGVVDALDPQQNILGGSRFLRVLANRFAGDLVKVLAAYHAGSSRVKRTGTTPFAATDDYVRKVLRTYYSLEDARAGG